METTDLTSIHNIVFILSIVFAGLFAAIAYYFYRFVRFQENELEEERRNLVQKPVEPDAAESRVKEILPEVAPTPVLVPVNPFQKTRDHIWGRIRSVFQTPLSEDEVFEQIEEILLTSDMGPQTVQRLTELLEGRLSGAERKDPERIRAALRDILRELFRYTEGKQPQLSAQPTVFMVVGVNGAGKTTTIGKLARSYAQAGKRILIAAGDTFRAAARDQLGVWAERAGVEIFSPPNVKDPAAVAFEALKKARAEKFDLVILDTAGRLHTQNHLMEELKKVKRVLQKIDPQAPHETLLVLDASSGQNALHQARQFHQALQVSGIVMTKMDGTGKGGVAVGLTFELGLPIYFLGVGEKAEDLRVFVSGDYIDGILGSSVPELEAILER